MYQVSSIQQQRIQHKGDYYFDTFVAEWFPWFALDFYIPDGTYSLGFGNEFSRAFDFQSSAVIWSETLQETHHKVMMKIKPFQCFFLFFFAYTLRSCCVPNKWLFISFHLEFIYKVHYNFRISLLFLYMSCLLIRRICVHVCARQTSRVWRTNSCTYQSKHSQPCNISKIARETNFSLRRLSDRARAKIFSCQKINKLSLICYAQAWSDENNNDSGIVSKLRICAFKHWIITLQSAQ